MMKLGFNCAGCEAAFEEILELCCWQAEDFFNYLEIGIAEGTTLLSVFNKVDAMRDSYTVTGVDLVVGPFFKPQVVFDNVIEFSIHVDQPINHDDLGLHVYLFSQPRKQIEKIAAPLHFVFIDGCHGAPCVAADFLAIEDKVAPGGIVCFHDAMPEDQGQHFQQHCGEPINVRKALEDLRLITDGPVRHDWRLLKSVSGDKSANPPGNGMVFFEKVL